MSRAKEVTVAGESFRFETHRRGYGYASNIAVNVKVYELAKPWSEEARKAFNALPEKLQDQAVDLAWEDAQRDWWEEARDKARELGLGTVSSEGRSGGWLVLDDWTMDRVEEVAEEVQLCCACKPGTSGREQCGEPYEKHRPGDLFESPWCENCGDTMLQHVRGYCPLVPGSTYAAHTYQSEQLDVLRRLDAFLDWCTLSTDKTAASQRLSDYLDHILTESEPWAEEVAAAKEAAALASGQS
jgi:hypothetical protein